MTKVLYSTKKVIWLTLDNSGVNTVNMPFGGFNSDFIVYKGAFSTLDFAIKDIDRKPLNLVGKTLVVNLIDYTNDELVLQKKLQVIDPYRGRAKLTLTPGDTENWSNGFYKYVTSVFHEDDTYTLLYTDLNQQARGVIEFKDSTLPKPHKSYELLGDKFHPDNNFGDPANGTWYVGESMPGGQQYGYSSNLSTIAIYTTNFSGKMWIEGSLEGDINSNHDQWFNIATNTENDYYSFNSFTGIEAFNIEANIYWLRVRYQPSIDNQGTFDKVIFKV